MTANRRIPPEKSRYYGGTWTDSSRTPPRSSSQLAVDGPVPALIARIDQIGRELPKYDDENPDTPPTNPEIHVHNTVHLPSPSHPDVETETEVSIGAVKVRGLPKWAIAVIGILVAAVTALLSRLLAP